MHDALPLAQGRILSFGPLPGVMAILNVTPDSFSDGGRFASAEAAAEEGARYADLGAAIVDIGGESTRPRGATYGEGAREISSNEEIARVIPVLSLLRRRLPSLPLSVDTRRAEVARAALDAGADVVNVVTGLDVPTDLLELVASRGAALVLNHCRGTPSTTFEESSFTDVIAEVAADLRDGPRPRDLLRNLRAERSFSTPVSDSARRPSRTSLSSARSIASRRPASRSSSARRARRSSGRSRTAPANDRLPESLAAVALAAAAARTRPVLVRVHDVAETLRFLAVLALASGDASRRVT